MRKLVCLSVISATAMLPGLSSTLYLPGVPDIITDLQTQQILVTLTLSLFILFNGIGALLWSAFSDSFSRRRFCYVISMLIFSISSIGCYFVQTIEGLIVLRCIQSFGASVANSIGAGSISDMYVKEERGSAVGLFSAGSSIGPLIGPVIGGAMANSAGWRSTFLLATAFGLAIFLLHIFCVPETFRDPKVWEKDLKDANVAPTLLLRKQPGFFKKLAENFKVISYNYVFLASVAGALPFAIMFTHETLIPNIYETQYGLSSTLVGISFLSGGFCNIIASIISGRMSDYYLKRGQRIRAEASKSSSSNSEQATNPEELPISDQENLNIPEDRITPFTLFCGIFVIPAGTLMFGLSVSYNASLALPIIGMGFICFGFMDSIVTSVTYLVDSLAPEGRAGSGSGVALLMRNVFAAILSFIAVPWKNAIGIKWVGVILAAISWLCTFGLLYLKIRGGKMREDVKQKKEKLRISEWENSS
ncbi:hypothetical protein HK100_007275 [Physocladia obscura]|uniref:Major facilitator superfamily (MFS) profile domain-containing protein n=1 Tax=Physocladia obscura TaxID=109957 RepID=A0AAD5T793_9FUNG|nr:hypothetical protein HK100_007275 [Physocladia obscura]